MNIQLAFVEMCMSLYDFLEFAILHIGLSTIKRFWVIMGGEEDNANDLPYRSEYAKSGRAKCKGCKVEIPKGDLRLASMTQVLRIDTSYEQ